MTAVLNFLKILPASHVRPLIVVFLLMLVAMLLETLSIGIFMPAIGLLTDPEALSLGNMATDGDSFLGSLSDIELILAGLGMLVCIFLVKSLYLSFFIWKQNAFSYSLLMKLTEELYLGYLRLPWLFHVQNNSAFLLRNINTEVNLAINNVLIPAIKLFSESLVLLGITLLLLYFEPIGSIAVMIFLLLAGALIQKVTKTSLLYWGELRQSSEGMRILQLQQGLGSAKEIKLLGRESRFVDNFRPYNLQSARAAQFRLFYQQIPRLFLEVIAVGGLAVLIMTLILQGKAVNTFLPIVGLFAVAVFRLMPSVNRILEAMQNLHYGAPSLAVLDSQLKEIRQHQDNTDEPRMTFNRDIVFHNVSFTYPAADKPVVEDLDLVITRGSNIGLIGSSGSGKTTLVDMLLGLMPPTKGEILVDSVNIREHEDGWKKCLGYVPQHISLLDDSLQNNIAFGLAETEIDTAMLDRSVKAAQLDELVASLPDGLQTNIGERGIKLSGGQRQRIGIARALYLDPQVLVLDEATSALDSETEQHIIDAINSLDDDKTIIIIAHRLTTVAHCDTVYRVQDGCIIQEPADGKAMQGLR